MKKSSSMQQCHLVKQFKESFILEIVKGSLFSVKFYKTLDKLIKKCGEAP